MASRLSLKAQLEELSQPAPLDLDPEDAQARIGALEHRLSIDDDAARQHYLEVAPSTLRKLHDSVADPKYDGVRTTRSQLLEHSDADSVDRDDGDAPHDQDEDDELESSESEDGLEPSDDGSDEDVHEDVSHPPPRTDIGTRPPHPGLPADSPGDDDIASNLRQTHEADKKKGIAVTRQIALWDALLDARIQLQKAVSAANRLPPPTEISRYTGHASARGSLDGFLDAASSLTEELFSLQEDLLKSNESIDCPPRKRRRVGTDDDPCEVVRELSASASALDACHHAAAVDTLAKWSAKVQAVAPAVLLPDARGSFLRDGKASAGVVTLIDDVLRTDGAKLLERTRQRRDKFARLGHPPASEAAADADADVFDDTDFYQQLLRDVVQARGGMAGAGEQQWMAEQRERKARKKKGLDTKASKGRKLRYEVHAKLQNFMVPVPAGGGEWHEEQIDGLFSSLLVS